MFIRFLAVFVAGIGLGLVANDLLTEYPRPAPMRAFPVNGIFHPRYGTTDCLTPTDDELAVYTAAVASIESVSRIESHLKLKSAALSLLAHGLYRNIDGRRKFVCVPSDSYSRTARVLEKSIVFGYMQDDQLTLSAKIPSPSEELIRAVADVAFSREPHIQRGGGTFIGRDLRPKARWVLASFGSVKKEYLELARDTMSAKDSLGTGAAQVAASSGDPAVLTKIEEMMIELLEETPQSDPIEVESRNRLYELGYALALAGDRSRPHLGPIYDLMSRNVESRSMFGLLGLSPKRMCGVIRAVEGKPAADAFSFCSDPEYPIAQ